MVNCYKCGRELTNGESVRLGIGPVCRSRAKTDLDKEIERSNVNSRCHKGLCCYNPDHGATLISRFTRRYAAMADQTGPPIQEFAQLFLYHVKVYRAAFGFDLDRVEVPSIEVPRFGPETIAELKLEPEADGRHAGWVKQPIDHDQQLRRRRLAAQNTCPFGLDCQAPQDGLRAVWQILYTLKDKMEPRLNTPEWLEWGWDHSLYASLAGIFTIHGQQDEANAIHDVRDEQAGRPRSYRLMF